MALQITEFTEQVVNNGRMFPVVVVPAVATQSMAVTAESTASAAFNSATRLVRITADELCRVEFGTDPVVRETSMQLQPGAVEYFGLPATGYKLAVIAV